MGVALHDWDDAALLLAVAGGDAQALGLLYDRYSGVLLGLADRLLGNRRDAEDLVHDVFVEAWARAADYDSARGTVRTWLALRLRSRAIDRHRSVAAQRQTGVDVHTLEVAAPESDGANADREVVHRVLAALPVEQRTVVELAFFEGWSSSEIAMHLQVPVGTVKSRAAAARSKLRAELGVVVGPRGALR